ncbi:hypothetical protein RQP46_000900 [Phenoliferia psychrophenolica]
MSTKPDVAAPKAAKCLKCGRGAHADPQKTRMDFCGNCKVASYCSRACQVADFAKHKKTCKKAKRTVATAAPAPVAAPVVYPILALQSRLANYSESAISSVLWILGQRYYDIMYEGEVLPVITVRLRYTTKDLTSPVIEEQLTLVSGDIVSPESFRADFIKSFRDPAASEYAQRVRAEELAEKLDLSEQLNQSALDPANSTVEWNDPLRHFLAAGPFDTQLARASATYDAFRSEPEYLERAIEACEGMEPLERKRQSVVAHANEEDGAEDSTPLPTFCVPYFLPLYSTG